MAWRRSGPSAIMIVYIDANTWNPELDPSRRASADLPRLVGLFERLDLHVVSPVGVPTHRSGTVIDWVLTSHPHLVSGMRVHGRECDQGCPLHPACFPALGSDHALLTFDLAVRCASDSAEPQEADGPRLLACDWEAGLAAASAEVEEIRAWLVAIQDVPGQVGRQISLDVCCAKVYELLWEVADRQGAVRVGPRGRPRRGCRWWTPACQSAWRARQRAHAVHRSAPSPGTREAWRVARNAFAHTVAGAQRAGWSRLLGDIVGRSRVNMQAAARTVRSECAPCSRRPPPQMCRGGDVLSVEDSRAAWAEHLGSQGPGPAMRWAGLLASIVGRWRARDPAASSPVSVEELRAATAGAAGSLGGAPGVDGLPYAPYLVQHPV